MSNDYEIITKHSSGVEVSEDGGKFSISCWDGVHEPEWVDVDNLTLDDIKDMNQKLTNIISYFDYGYKGSEVKY